MNTSTPTNKSRRIGLALLALAVLAGALGYGAYWFGYARHFEGTDDAYVNGDVVQISSQEPGTVLAVHVDDTQPVAVGAPLVDLDPADAQIAMGNAQAELARTVRQVRALFAQVEQLRAQIAQRQSALATAEADLRRREGLLADGAISGEELSHARDNVTGLHAALTGARQQLEQTLAQTQGTSIETHPQVLAAAAAVRTAALALHRTHLSAPVAGLVAKRTVEVGQRVAAGAPLLAVVPLDDVWIDANFKEVQLARMRPGQPVSVTVDVYGSGVTFHGHLVGLGAGSGSAFALLPAQNASGNWIKIVQRVPVRILLDPQELRGHPLRVGLSAHVSVDLRNADGADSPPGQLAVRNHPQPVQQSAGDDPAIEQTINRIIAENAGAQAVARL